MANLSLHFLLIFLSFHSILATITESVTTQNQDNAKFMKLSDTVTTQNPDATNFIKISCKKCLYPTICIQSLSTYANTIQLNKQQLAHAALSVSLSKAKIASTYISMVTRIRGLKPRELQAAKDCSNTMNDSVYQLSRSIPELGQSGKLTSRRDEFTWHVSNVQTWISAALTDENTCLDMFNNPSMDGKIKDSVRARVFAAAQVTSNALALVYQFAENHS
ncbi:21 kDa protein-like [Lycium barbarum]|uniref:21 kDa protein-like n=1 Tax=Lycium barbarum TaxID=112863 RepID=UPI00293ECDC8|nr:21 kDa protein-like [Lycium barbarum]